MTFELFLSLDQAMPVAEAERFLALTNDLRPVLAKHLEAFREHYARKQRGLAQRQLVCCIGDAAYTYHQGRANQAGFEPEEWAGEFERLDAARKVWATQRMEQEEQT